MRAPFLLLAASVTGAGAEAPKAPALSKLEELVTTMAADQDAPVPKKAQTDADVVILEEQDEELNENRRQLTTCACTSYVNGAQPGDAHLCIKDIRARNGGGVCAPYNGGCNSDQVWCTMQAAASPQPLGRMLDAVEQEEVEEEHVLSAMYVNANVQLTVPQSVTALPQAAAFAAVFAAKAGVTNTHVQAQTTDGATAGPQGSTVLSVHVTIHVSNNLRRRAVEAVIRELAQLTVEGATFQVAGVDVFPSADHPLICTPQSETIKAESRALLQQLVELRQQEVALLRAAVTSGAETCSTTALNALATHVGMPLQ